MITHPRMVHEYYVERLRAIAGRRSERLTALKTKADALAYIEDVRQAVQSAFGPFPERTPLHARVTGVHEYPTHVIENILYESRPGFLVSANLCRPPASIPASSDPRQLSAVV